LALYHTGSAEGHDVGSAKQITLSYETKILSPSHHTSIIEICEHLHH